MTYAIITPILFAAYLIDGIDYIQNLFLESVCCYVDSKQKPDDFRFCQPNLYIYANAKLSLIRSCFQLWNFIAVVSFLGLGVKTIWIWHAGKSDDTTSNTTDFANNYPSGLALGALRWGRVACTESLNKAFPRLRDSASWRGGELTEPRKILFEGLCMVLVILIQIVANLLLSVLFWPSSIALTSSQRAERESKSVERRSMPTDTEFGFPTLRSHLCLVQLKWNNKL